MSRAEQIFGIHVSPHLTPAGVAGLAGELGEDANARADAVTELTGRVEVAYQHLGHPRGPAGPPAYGAGLRRADQVHRSAPRTGSAGGRAGRRRPARDRAGARPVAQPGAEGVAGAGHVPLGSAAAADRVPRSRPTRGAAPPRGSWPTCGRPWRPTSSPSSFLDALSDTEQAVFDWLAEAQPPPPPPQPPRRVPASGRAGGAGRRSRAGCGARRAAVLPGEASR